jgi:adhesin transport system membrane fusion protein
LLELKREQERAKVSKLQSQTKIETSKISITELKQRLGALQNEYRSEALALLSQTIADRRELLKALPSIKERVNRSTVRSPMDGIINRVNYRTDGAYVSVGDILLELVPTDEGLKLEGRINPKDISKIAIGDSAKIRLSAYDSAKYGSIKGIVTSISPDAIIPKQGDGEAYYAIDVTWEETLQLSTGEYITLIPGMTASVDVVSGKRSVLDYFWAPISRLQELALRD